MHPPLGIIITVSWLAFAAAAHAAEEIRITPLLVDSSAIVEQALQQNKGRAKTNLEGVGSELHLTYTASQPILMFLFPLDGMGSFVPTDTLSFTLPAVDEGAVSLDLTVSPGWSPGMRQYLVNMLSRDENATLSFSDVTFVPASLFTNIKAALRHAFTAEPYTPSTYHALRGYRVMGVSVVIVFGILTLSAAIIILLVSRGRRLPLALALLIGAQLLYSARFSVDELRFAAQHLQSWYSDGTFDEAGSIFSVADVLKKASRTAPVRVFVCRDGTNFKEKLLRYSVYPAPVSADPVAAAQATHALVMDRIDWSYDDRGTLHCGDTVLGAKELKRFVDGSRLFSVFRM